MERNPLPVRVTPKLLERIDAVRPALIPREPFVRHLIDLALKRFESGEPDGRLTPDRADEVERHGTAGWRVLHSQSNREVRVSPSGIVVVEDRVEGKIRHTRVYPDGRHAQVVDDTPQQAWLAARKRAI